MIEKLFVYIPVSLSYLKFCFYFSLLVCNGIEAYPQYSKGRPHPSMDTEHSKRVRQVYIRMMITIISILLCILIRFFFYFQLHSLDPLWCVSLPQLLSQQLETCLSSYGYERYRSLLIGIDIVIREQCLEFLPPERAKCLMCFDS